jgi:hypothetical protein
MNEKTKQKLAYWAETLIYIGMMSFGFSILIGGFYALYVVIKALLS